MSTDCKPRILAIDDIPSNLAMLGASLEQEFDVQIATSGMSGIALASATAPDLILLDVMMPEINGFETCRHLKADPRLRNIPIIFLTAMNDAESESAGLALGAVDYITKPIKIGIARHRIRNLLEREALRKELHEQRDQLRQLAFYDTLTGLPNRRLLNDRLTLAVAASKRSGQHGALMFLDLDNFKPLNDRHGHAVGDLLLKEVGARLKRCIRETDTAARFGGDEFVVMLGELGADPIGAKAQAEKVAEKIRAALGQPYLLKLQKDGTPGTALQHQCSASIGVALLHHQDGSTEDFLKWADIAMYQAKDGGRNLIRFHQSH